MLFLFVLEKGNWRVADQGNGIKGLWVFFTKLGDTKSFF